MMSKIYHKALMKHVLYLALSVAVALLAACASDSDKFKPVELGPNPALLGVRSVWQAKMGAVDFVLTAKVDGVALTLASSDGTVVALDTRTGADLWRVNVGHPIAAGVGSDGQITAVVTQTNELVALKSGILRWRVPLFAQVLTAPLVAGARVFVLGGDRSVSAFDAQSGRQLWQYQQSADALVLRQAGVLMAVGDTLVVGMSGHLLGLNPSNGAVVWDAPIANPRGNNEIERLVDLVEGVSRQGTSVCVRAFHSSVGCVDNGRVSWSRPAQGFVGLAGDAQWLYGVESDGKVLTWRRSDGAPGWVSYRLFHHTLTRPLVSASALVFGDEAGRVHWLARGDGALLARTQTDGSALATAIVQAGSAVVAVTRSGGIFAFQAQ
jgi:outer membrane assembly lipoprotein YfgL